VNGRERDPKNNGSNNAYVQRTIIRLLPPLHVQQTREKERERERMRERERDSKRDRKRDRDSKREREREKRERMREREKEAEWKEGKKRGTEQTWTLSEIKGELILKGRLHLRFGCAVWMCVSLSYAFSMSFPVSKTKKLH
jgi:hypothetical protein